MANIYPSTQKNPSFESHEHASLSCQYLTKTLRDTLPKNIKLSPETHDLLTKCCVEFAQILASESNDISLAEGKEAITPEHILDAVESLGFGHYRQEMQAYLASETYDAPHSKTRGKGKKNKVQNEDEEK